MNRNEVFTYWGRCVRLARRNNAAFANDWQWVWGSPLVALVAGWCASKYGWAQVTGWPTIDALLVAFAAFLITWCASFLRRLFVAPAQLDRGLRNTLRFCEQKVQHLEEAAAPRLAFEIAADARWFFQRPGEADCYISVRNTSTAKTIDDVRVFLEWHSAGQRSKIQTSEKVLRLQFREGSVMNIPPTGLAHFRLCTIFDEPWPAPEKHAYIERIVFAPEVDASRAPKYATGTYEVHVRAEGRDVPPVPAAFILFSHLTTTDLRLDPTKIGADWPSL